MRIEEVERGGAGHVTRMEETWKIQVLWNVTPCRWTRSSARGPRTVKFGLLHLENVGTVIFRNVANYSPSNSKTSQKTRVFGNAAMRTPFLIYILSAGWKEKYHLIDPDVDETTKCNLNIYQVRRNIT